MDRNSVLEGNIDIDTRDLQINILKMQNCILKDALNRQKFINSQSEQQTIKDLRQQFTHEIIDSFEKTFGFKVISTSAAYESSSLFNNSEHDTKTMKVTINYEGEN